MNETIKTVSSPELLAEAQKAFNKANGRLMDIINNPKAHQDEKAYLRAASEEARTRAQLEAIRNTQYKNVFIEQNAAKGLNQ